MPLVFQTNFWSITHNVYIWITSQRLCYEAFYFYLSQCVRQTQSLSEISALAKTEPVRRGEKWGIGCGKEENYWIINFPSKSLKFKSTKDGNIMANVQKLANVKHFQWIIIMRGYSKFTINQNTRKYPLAMFNL